MNPELANALESLERIQSIRRKNWPSPDSPRNEKLEACHVAQIATLKARIEEIQTGNAGSDAPGAVEKP